MATTTFNDLITFSRGSNATVTGPNGLIQWAPANLVLNSQDLEAATWTKNSSSVTANNATAPDGTQTADTWIPTSSGNTAGVRLIQTVTTPVGFVQTASVYVKSTGKRWVYMTTPAALSPTHNCWFDLQNGVVGTMGGAVLAATITPAGSGWFRITTTSATTLSSNYIFLSTSDADNSDVVTANGTGIQVWGAQLELGSTATTYNNTSVRNLLGFSEAFDNAAWTKDRCSIVTGAQANPVNGLFNAQKLMEDTTASASHRTRQTVNLSGVPVTFSAYLKAGERNWAYLRIDDASSVKYAYFNLSTGVAGFTTSGLTSSITSVGNGWYRCSTTFAAPAATATGVAVIGLATANTPDTYTGDGNSGVYIYGAMLSNSASLDPYVPTPGAAPSSTAYYGPRFDYDPVTLLPRGLLVEEARTNLLPFSEQFDNAAWSKQNTTITANSAVAPDGTMTADTLTAATTGLFRYVQQQPTLTNGVTYTLTAYLKYKTARWVWLLGETTTDAFAVFDVLNGAVGDASSGITRSITPVGNGWYRCTATFLVGSATATQQVGIGLSDTNTVSNPPATAGIDAYIWGIQLEAGAFATSYIPTIASTVTRAADIATITGSLFSQWWNQPRGSFVAEMDTLYSNVSDTASIRAVFTADDGTANNLHRIYQYTNLYGGNTIVGGVNQSGINLSTIGVNTPAKASYAYEVNSFSAAMNGTLGPPDTSGTLPTPNRLAFGAVWPVNGHIRAIRYVPARLADFQLQALTELPLVPTLDADFLNNLYEA